MFGCGSSHEIMDFLNSINELLLNVAVYADHLKSCWSHTNLDDTFRILIIGASWSKNQFYDDQMLIRMKKKIQNEIN